jgi:ABC-2 type transport system ATP-binding protein
MTDIREKMDKMNSTQHAVYVNDVSKSYGKVEALKGVSFSVNPGELFGLIGPDGAGKTTLFRILTTLLLADKGTAAVGNSDVVKDYKSIRRKVGYMPGRFSLYQDLTVEENLNFFATVFHTTIEENYDLVKDIYQQIEPFRKRRAGALSGGMKQKLALCCALIHKPEILFLDEPTTGVDPVSRKEFWEMLQRLKEQGITILASTPIMDEARQCDRIAFINEGEIKGIDTPDRILHRFADILCPPGLQHDERQRDTGTAIEVEQLVKRFGNFTAVDHISFRVERGEIFGFLGANGAGKTTAMRMLCGLSKPTSGIARVAGYDVRTQSEEVKKNIGYMSQKFSLYEDLKVWENIRLFAGIYGMKEDEIARKTDELLNRLGFSEERNTLVKSLPVGWKQKLAFSVSIFHEPEIVFLDEPTGGVDPATRRQFWELIYQAAERGITVFVTTHYMDEAEYCDRISIMVDGRIEALNTPDKLKQQFGVQTMDDVFQQLARKAVRKAD